MPFTMMVLGIERSYSHEEYYVPDSGKYDDALPNERFKPKIVIYNQSRPHHALEQLR